MTLKRLFTPVCQKGFTLIELAIVLIIVGLLVGLGSGMVAVLSSAVKVRESRETLDANVQAVNSWASANSRIPHALSGFGNFSSVAKSRQDSWGRDFIYLYDANLATTPPTKDTICGRRSTTLTVQSADPAATISNIAFVVISKSDDATLQTTASDAAITISRSAVGTVNLDANNSDIVRWVTLDELRSKVGCQGAPLKIVNNELPYGNYSTSYSATIAPDGGTGGYEWRIKSSAMPAGVTFSPAMGLNPSTGKFTNLSTSSTGSGGWTSASNLIISGWPRPITSGSGSYSLTIQLRDTSGNYAYKPYVMTVNPKNN